MKITVGVSISVGSDLPQELNKRWVSQLSWGLSIIVGSNKKSIMHTLKIWKFENLKLCFHIITVNLNWFQKYLQCSSVESYTKWYLLEWCLKQALFQNFPSASPGLKPVFIELLNFQKVFRGVLPEILTGSRKSKSKVARIQNL